MVRRQATDRHRSARARSARARPRRGGESRHPHASAAELALSCSNPIQIGMLGPFTGPVALDRRRPAALGAVLRHATGTRRTSSEAQRSSRATRSSTRRRPRRRAVVRVELEHRRRHRPGRQPGGHRRAPILKKAGLAFISGSATSVSLTDGKLQGLLLPRRPERRRPGPDRGRLHDDEARRQEGRHGHDRRRPGVVLDRPRRHRRQRRSRRPASTVDRESISQKATDFSSLVAKVDELDEGRLPAVPARVAGAALRPAAEGAGQDGDRVRQRRHVRLVEVQRDRELRLVLRSGRDDDPGRQGDRRRVQQGSSRAARARSARRTTCAAQVYATARSRRRARTARSPAPSSGRASPR